ncbi:MAG TPA: peptidylprolyl isomerase [Polyangiales bacterium]|nr:peptidylprolyl isomerase [Polyangiales bacterium]
MVLWVCLSACGEQVSGFLHGGDSHEVVEISGDVVSRVDGSAIGTHEVERLAQVGNLPPNAALSRLQAERLLGQEAKSRGYERQAQTELLAREALVQELLVDAVEPVEVSTAELEAEYATHKARFKQPEKRRSAHVLAIPDPAGGEAAARSAESFIQKTIESLLYTREPEAALAAASGMSDPAFKVVVQELPLSADDGTFVPEFSRALFAVRAPGVVPNVVKTQFGYHAIWVHEIVPAREEPQSVAFETLRGEIATRKQTQRLDALLNDLRKRTPVKFAPDAQKILATLDF